MGRLSKLRTHNYNIIMTAKTIRRKAAGYLDMDLPLLALLLLPLRSLECYKGKTVDVSKVREHSYHKSMRHSGNAESVTLTTLACCMHSANYPNR